MFKDKTAVVTGGAGFIGSHLCEKLLEAGARVVAVDDLSTGSRQNIAHLTAQSNFLFVEANVTADPQQYLASITNIDVLFHFASAASPEKYQAKPIETYLVNSYATHLLLEHLRAHFPKAQFFFASTSEIYGNPLQHPQTEAYWGNVNPNGIRSCYDESKRMGETICGVHQRDFGMDVRIIRIFNTYGPRMDLEDGRVIPDFIRCLSAGAPLQIFGDGQQTRSFCFVDDLVEGILLFSSHQEGSGRTLNLGNPEEHTILEAAQIIQEVSGKKAEVVFKELPQDDPTRRKPDISQAQALLGWQPKVSFREGLEKTLHSFSQVV